MPILDDAPLPRLLGERELDVGAVNEAGEDLDEILRVLSGIQPLGWGPTGENPLDVSKRLSLTTWHEAPEVDQAIHELGQELRKINYLAGAQRRVLNDHLRILLLNLYQRWLASPEEYVSYERGDHAYQFPRKYNPKRITPRSLKRVVDGLADLGYVESVRGFFDRRVEIGRISRVRAERRLVDRLTARYGFVPDFVLGPGVAEPIRLKDWDGNWSDYVDTEATIAMRERLRRYNELVAAAQISLSNEGRRQAEQDRVIVDFCRKHSYRIFNRSSFECLGRFYGPWWQGIPSELRQFILIEGQHTVECDYQALHIHLLYGLEGLDYEAINGNRDPYDLGDGRDDLRGARKAIVLVALNAHNHRTTVLAAAQVLRDEFPPWVRDQIDTVDVIDRFKETHPRIGHYLASDIGIRLQNIDATITDYVYERMTEEGLVTLGIHDSFIVDQVHRESLIQAMQDAICAADCRSVPNIRVNN